MREIKFRAWNSDKAVLAKVSEIEFDTNRIIVYGDHFVWDLRKDTLEQYIGRKDVNDKEIYEGDIVSVDVQDYPAGYARETIFIGVIVFEESTCDFCVKLSKRPKFHGEEFPSEICGLPVSGGDDYEYDYFWFDDSVNDEDIEVIGNIHENPELLEAD